MTALMRAGKYTHNGKSLVWAMLLFLFAIPVAQAQTLELSDADFVLSDTVPPPPDDAAWQSQALPDQWRKNHPGIDGTGWYRFRFDLLVAGFVDIVRKTRNQ